MPGIICLTKNPLMKAFFYFPISTFISYFMLILFKATASQMVHRSNKKFISIKKNDTYVQIDLKYDN